MTDIEKNMKNENEKQLNDLKLLQKEQAAMASKLEAAQKIKDREESAARDRVHDSRRTRAPTCFPWLGKEKQRFKEAVWRSAQNSDDTAKAVYQEQLSEAQKKEDELLAAHGLDLDSTDPALVERVQAMVGSSSQISRIRKRDMLRNAIASKIPSWPSRPSKPKAVSVDVEKDMKVQEVKQMNEWKAMQGETSEYMIWYMIYDHISYISGQA